MLGLDVTRASSSSAASRRLLAELDADGLLRARAVVALVEQEVERALHGPEPRQHLPLGAELEELHGPCEDLLAARDALRDRGVRAEERARDLADAEAAEDVQHEDDLRLLRQPRMAAGEHHPELIVLESLGLEHFVDDGRERPLRVEQPPELGRERPRGALAPEDIERRVLRGRHEPRGRVVRHAAELPHRERAAEGVLNDVLRQRQVVDPEDTCERRDHAPRLATEQVLHRRPVFEILSHMSIFITGRTSTSPPTARMGQPRDSSAACWMSLASTSV